MNCILSSVGGSAVERIVNALNEKQGKAKQVKLFTPELWRRWMSVGRHGQILARAGAFGVFPALAVVKALIGAEGVLIPTTNPFFLPHLLLATSAWHGHRVVPLIYDMYPDAWEAAGMAGKDSRLSNFVTSLNRWLFANADAVVFIGENMARYAIKRYGKPRVWRVIETGADLNEFEHAENKLSDAGRELDEWLNGRMLMTYTGNLGCVHDWRTLANGLSLVLSSPLKGDVACLIAASGPGAIYLKNRLKGLGKSTIRFEEPLDDERWAQTMARSSISLVTLAEKAVHTSIPSKTFSGMAAGNAIVAISSNGSDLSDVVIRHKCGHVLYPGDVEGFALAVEKLVCDREWRSQCANNARNAVLTNYDMPLLAEKWKVLLSEVASKRARLPGYERAKRLMDVVVSAAALIVTTPVMLFTAAAIRATMGSPVLFRQKRPGLKCRPFEILKFRTMSKSRDGEKWFRTDNARLTSFGRLLRKTSIDELPELYNVLKGQMSLVGPRPLLMEYLEKYTEQENRRHEVLPGITGWAQVNGRQNIPFSKRIELDVWYVDNRSLLVDLKTVAMTIFGIAKSTGVISGQNVDDVDDLGLSSDRSRKQE